MEDIIGAQKKKIGELENALKTAASTALSTSAAAPSPSSSSSSSSSGAAAKAPEIGLSLGRRILVEKIPESREEIVKLFTDNENERFALADKIDDVETQLEVRSLLPCSHLVCILYIGFR